MNKTERGALEASRESQMVVLERDASGTPTIWCDPEIVDLVRALNTGDLRTVASCSGHGEQHGNIALKDGRELLIAPDYDTARQMERALLAALRLREECQRLEQRWRDRENFDCYVRSDEQFSGVLRGRDICADDLARILEQTK